MFLYMFAFMITSVVEQDFFVQKACRVNNNFTDEICSNIMADENAIYKRQVQVIHYGIIKTENALKKN